MYLRGGRKRGCNIIKKIDFLGTLNRPLRACAKPLISVDQAEGTFPRNRHAYRRIPRAWHVFARVSAVHPRTIFRIALALRVTDYKHRVIQAASVFLPDEMKFLASDEICQFRHITSRLHDYKIVLGRLIRVSVLLLCVVSSVNWRIS